MIQLFTQPKTMEGLSASENSQAVKFNSSDHLNEGGFGKHLSDVLQKFMGSGERGENQEYFEGEGGNLVSPEDSPLVHTAFHSKESEQIQIRFVPDKQFNMKEPSAGNEISEKLSTDTVNESNERQHSGIKVSSEGVSLEKIFKNIRHLSTASEIKGQFVKNDSAISFSNTAGITEISKIKSDEPTENVQVKKTGITLKEVFAGNNHNAVSTAETANSSKFGEGVSKHYTVTDEGAKLKKDFNPVRLFEGLNLENNQSPEKTDSVNSQIADHTGKENNQMTSSGANKPVRDLMNRQAAGLTVSKESVPSAEKKSNTSNRSHLSKLSGEGERDSLKSTERMDLQQTEKTATNKTHSRQKLNPVNNFDPELPQTDSKEPESKIAGELSGSDSNDKKISNTREPVALRPEQSVGFQQAERRNLSVRLARIVKQELQSGKAQGQGWKKHQFTLDDGTKVQLSLRKSEGVIQLQLGSVNSELNKLIQQNAQEIRQHLEEQMNAEVSLQFQEASSENENNLFSDKNSGSEQTDGNSHGKITNTPDKQLPHEGRRTRLFGFNSNEWTA